MKRFFVFLLAFVILIGGTLAPVQAASVAADDDGIMLADYDSSDSGSGTILLAFYNNDIIASTLVSTYTFTGNYTNQTIYTVDGNDANIWRLYGSQSDEISPAGYYTVSFSWQLSADIYSEITEHLTGYTFLYYTVGANNYQYCTNIDVHRVDNDNTLALYGTVECEMAFNIVSVCLYFDSGFSFDDFKCYMPYYSFTSTTESVDLTTTNGLISNVVDGISNVVTVIASLPAQIIDLFIDAMQSLFIPSDGYFDDKFSATYDLFDAKLGFLLYPFDVLEQLVNALQGASDGFVIDFPAFSITIAGTSYKCWDSYTFDFDYIVDNFPDIFSAAQVIFTVIFCGYTLDLIYFYYDLVIWGIAVVDYESKRW